MFSFKKLNYTEPAVLRGIVSAVVSLLAAVGVTVGTNITGAAEASIITFAAVWPLVQALWTRMAVFSKKTVETKYQPILGKARPLGPQTPGVADHARE